MRQPALGLAWLLLIPLAGCRSEPASGPDHGGRSGAPPAHTVAPVSGPVTFAKDVAPILYANCVTCHRPGQVAPFSLLTYHDASTRARAIADMTTAREMPPWLPAPGAHVFEGERRLTDDAIARLRAWADAGAPEGDRASAPAPPSFPDGWQLGKPDLVVQLAEPFVLQPDDRDRFRQMVFPVNMTAGRFVRAVELKPGSSRVHHAVIRIDRTSASRRKDAEDDAPGFDGAMAPDVRNPDGHFLGWAPGRGPIVSPRGMPWRLERGTDLVVELHLVKGQQPANVAPAIALYFTNDAPTAFPVELTMGVMTLDIPAGDRAYRVSQSIEMPADVTLLALTPHAHYLGKSIEITATRPGGTPDRLLSIPHWNFHWQQEYRLKSPVDLPKGTSLTMSYLFDNSPDNEHNPADPPVRVTYGLQSTDEMANLVLQVLPKTQAEGRLVGKAFADRHLQEVVASAELAAKREPDNPAHLWELGKAYVDAGRMADALAPLESAVRANPRFARAQDYLGRALFASGQINRAVDHLQRAVALDPADELLFFDLGKVLADLGRMDDALKAFDRVLAINAEHGQAFEGRGVAYLRQGRFSQAVAAFERAVQLMPDSPSAENGLAVALAQSGRMKEALIHVQRALDLDANYKPALDNLRKMRGKGQ